MFPTGVGMNRLQAAKGVIRFVFPTGVGMKQNHGFVGVIAKPFKITELGKVLNKALTGEE